MSGARGAPANISRRRLLRWGALGMGVAVTGCRGVVVEDLDRLSEAYPAHATRVATESGPTPSPGPTAPPISARDLGFPTDIAVTPEQDFYSVKYGSVPHAADPFSYRLTVSGLVTAPLQLDLQEVKSLPAHDILRTLECISNPPGGGLIGNAAWKGARMADLLDAVGPRAGATAVHLTSYDGYDTSIPLDLAMDPESYVAYEMNGAQLPLRHGYPLRCLFPGRYGQKQPKWLAGIEVVAESVPGHWESQGWSDDATIQVNSRIDVPADGGRAEGPVAFSGVAFSDTSGVASVEVFIDDQSLGEATVRHAAPPFAKTVWTEWEWAWAAPEPGNHVLMVKARDGNGVAQRRPRGELLDDTKPDGTSAMQRVRFFVP